MQRIENVLFYSDAGHTYCVRQKIVQKTIDTCTYLKWLYNIAKKATMKGKPNSDLAKKLGNIVRAISEKITEQDHKFERHLFTSSRNGAYRQCDYSTQDKITRF